MSVVTVEVLMHLLRTYIDQFCAQKQALVILKNMLSALQAHTENNEFRDFACKHIFEAALNHPEIISQLFDRSSAHLLSHFLHYCGTMRELHRLQLDDLSDLGFPEPEFSQYHLYRIRLNALEAYAYRLREAWTAQDRAFQMICQTA